MSTDRAMSRPQHSPLQPILTEIRPVPTDQTVGCRAWLEAFRRPIS